MNPGKFFPKSTGAMLAAAAALALASPLGGLWTAAARAGGEAPRAERLRSTPGPDLGPAGGLARTPRGSSVAPASAPEPRPTPRSTPRSTPRPAVESTQQSHSGAAPDRLWLGAAPLAFQDYYELTVSKNWEWPEADVKLLTDANPIPLGAALRTVRPLPAGWREVGRGVRWRADGGSLSEEPSLGDNAPARWTPPADSRLTTLTAEAWVRVEAAPASAAPARAGAPGPDGDVYVFGSKTLRYLSALPSAGLKNGMLNGYNIGEYPALPHSASKTSVELLLKHLDRYQSPKLYYRVDKDSKPLKLSPNLTLGAFVIDFPWGSLGMPQYIALDLNLPRKLEMIIDMMRSDGYKVTTLTPIYGYRPPSFNLGTMAANPKTNLKVRYSMHQYGRAFDFIIDEDGDLRMDDLNGDGRINAGDSNVIMGYVDVLDHLEAQLGNWGLVGGAGLYARHDFVTRRQTPYIHVDTRGFLGTGGSPMRWSEN